MRSLLFVFMLFYPINETALFSIAKTLSINENFYIQDNSSIFRSVKVVGNDGKYLVTGKAKPTMGKFYYSVEDGHIEYIKDTQVEMKEKNSIWEPFQIQIRIPKEKLPDNSSLLVFLYERNNEGQIIHSYPIVLQKFH
jgi:hypothetical protein